MLRPHLFNSDTWSTFRYLNYNRILQYRWFWAESEPASGSLGPGLTSTMSGSATLGFFYVYKVSVEDRTYHLYSHAIAGVYGASEEAVGVFASLTELALPGELFMEISLKELIKLICLKFFYCIPWLSFYPLVMICISLCIPVILFVPQMGKRNI